jgi:hypothetical protein
MTTFLSSLHELIPQLAIASNSREVLSLILGDSFHHAIVLAQQVSDPDIMGQIKNAWDNFVESGQIWALIIGTVIGYLFRGVRGT